jgi:hypothetical protein
MGKATTFVLGCFAAALIAAAPAAHAQSPSRQAAARAIAKEAYIYGFPLVDSYRIQYAYFVDRGGPEYKAPWNQIFNNARVYTPEDRAIQTPNSDTPYSYIGADLRAEPLVLSVPAVEKGRYYSLQFIDMFTFNFAYVGSRATGNGPGRFLLAGPRWKGRKPSGIKTVIRSETDFVSSCTGRSCSTRATSRRSRRSRPATRSSPCRRFWGSLRRERLPPSTSSSRSARIRNARRCSSSTF